MFSLNKKSLLNIFCISIVLGSTLRFYKLYLLHIVVALFFVFYWQELFKIKQYLRQNNFSLLFLIYAIVRYFISILWAESAVDVFRYLFYIIICSSIPVILISNINDLSDYKKIYKLIKYLFIAELFLCVFEIIFGLHLPTSPYSDTRLFLTDNSDKITPLIAIAIKHVPTGFHHNPNNLAITIACIMPFFIIQKKIVIKYLFSLICLIVIVMTGSRGVFLATALGCCLNTIIYRPKKIFLQILSCIFIGIMILPLLSQESLNKLVHFTLDTSSALVRYIDFSTKSDESIGYRKQLILNGLNSLSDNYYIGVGAGNSTVIQKHYDAVANNLSSMHNFWIEVLVDVGPIFLIIFIFWYCFIMFKISKISFYCTNFLLKRHAQALFISFIIFSIGCVSASSVIYHFPMWLMFAWALIIIKISKLQTIKDLNLDLLSNMKGKYYENSNFI